MLRVFWCCRPGGGMVQPRETPHDAGSRHYRPLETGAAPILSPATLALHCTSLHHTLAPGTPPAEELSAWCKVPWCKGRTGHSVPLQCIVFLKSGCGATNINIWLASFEKFHCVSKFSKKYLSAITGRISGALDRHLEVARGERCCRCRWLQTD